MYRSNNNEYLKTMKPMLYLMKIICAMPFWIKRQRELSWFISSKMVGFVSIVACIFFHIQFEGYVLDLIIALREKNIIRLVAAGPEMFFEGFCLAVPAIMLRRHKEMQKYWNAWKEFQSKYENITETEYVSRKKKYVKVAALVCILWLAWRSFYSAWFYYHIFDGFLGYLVNDYFFFSVYIISLYWVANCGYFSSIAEDMLVLEKKIINEKKDYYKLNKLISLWLDLCDLTNNFNEAHSFIYLTFFMLIVISIITYLYALLHYSTYKIVYPYAVYINFLSMFVIFLLIICESSHSVHYEMNYRQKETLLQANGMIMEPAMLKSVGIILKVSRFLHAISLRDPTMHLNGFFSLNRFVFPTIVTLSINYLIILRQFSDA